MLSGFLPLRDGPLCHQAIFTVILKETKLLADVIVKYSVKLYFVNNYFYYFFLKTTLIKALRDA